MKSRHSEHADIKLLMRKALIGLVALYAVLVIIDIPLSDSVWLMYCLGIPYLLQSYFNSYVPFYIAIVCQLTLLALAIRSMRRSVIVIALTALALNALAGYILYLVGKTIGENIWIGPF